AIVLLGRNTGELGGSEYLKTVHDRVAGDAPALDLEAEAALHGATLEAIRAGLVRSAHDCAEGGLAVALAESAFADPARPFGVQVDLGDDLPSPALLFGEAQSRIVVACAPESVEPLLALARGHGVPAVVIGRVGPVGGEFRIGIRGGGIRAPVAELAGIYYSAIPRRMDGSPADVETSLESEVQHA
ncbi:MAG TPA: AIR synthase-related protein, partial [Longimicrobiaceae bacterium]|nr:AIR synthase-related protein [Longimicrobiaceae bacterium]